MRVGIYARLSQNRAGESTSIDRQIEACRKRMEDTWEEVAVYRDDDISAYSGKVRPGFEQMVADIEAGHLDIVLSYALDRLGRRPKDIERLLETGIRFICVRDSVDSVSTSSELFIRILAAMAKMESDTIGARIRLKHDELKSKGMSGGGRFLGWTPEGASILQRASEELISGKSLRQVAHNLQQDRTSLRRRLLSPYMVGRRVPDGPAGMPAVVDEGTWRRVQAILTDPSRPVPPARAKRLLTGLAVCGLCGHKLLGHRHKQDRYACYRERGGCGRITVNTQRLDEHVLRVAHDYLWNQYASIDLTVSIRQQQRDEERATLQAELDGLKDKLYPLIDMYTSGQLTLGEWQRAREGMDARINELEAKLSVNFRRSNSSTVSIELEGSDPRQWLHDLIEKVVVHPSKERGRRFDSSRVEILFRT